MTKQLTLNQETKEGVAHGAAPILETTIVYRTLHIRITNTKAESISVPIRLEIANIRSVRMNILCDVYFIRSGDVYRLNASDIVTLLVKAVDVIRNDKDIRVTDSSALIWSFKDAAFHWPSIESAIIEMHQQHEDILPSRIEFHSIWTNIKLHEIRLFGASFQKLQTRFPNSQMNIVGCDVTTESFLHFVETEDTQAFAKQLYERYKLEWLLAHGYTLQDVIDGIEQYRTELMTDAEEDKPDVRKIFEQWQDERGFDSQIWACFPEFCMCELRDKDYMKKLLTAQERQRYRRLLFEDMQYE